MPAALMSRDEVIDRLMAVFRDTGYEGATLARLSDATGLGKASLYHHFPGGKADMAAAVLDRADEWLGENVVAPLEAGGSAADRLNRMARTIDSFYDRGRTGCLLAALALGAARQPFQDRLAGIFRGWIGALAAVLRQAGVPAAEAARRAEDAVTRIQGALILSAGLGSTAPFRRTVKELPEALLAGLRRR